MSMIKWIMNMDRSSQTNVFQGYFNLIVFKPFSGNIYKVWNLKLQHLIKTVFIGKILPGIKTKESTSHGTPEGKDRLNLRNQSNTLQMFYYGHSLKIQSYHLYEKR